MRSAFSSKSGISVYNNKVLHQSLSDNPAKKHWDDKIKRGGEEEREVVLLPDPICSRFSREYYVTPSTYGKWKRHVRNIWNKRSSRGGFCKKCGRVCHTYTVG